MEKIIETIEEFIIECFQIEKVIEDYNNNWRNHEHKGLAFRGQTDKEYELLPAIGRGRAFSCDISILDQERNLIEMAKYKLPHIFRSDLLPIDLLAVLQHYGIPTRLLDVTSNPLVALYFACSNTETDGEVVVFEYTNNDKTNYPLFNAIAETYKFSFTTFEPLSSFYAKVIHQSYFNEQRYTVFDQTNEQGGEWIKFCCEKLLFVNATERLERQKLQQGFYILFPNEISCYDESNFYFEKMIQPIEKNHTQIKQRLVIKKDEKSEIRKKLEFLGISEATLFADNIDIVCKNIVEQCKRIKF